MSNPTACLIIIGNEILSGRTKDKNLPWLAEQLNMIGVTLAHARVIRDEVAEIVDTVNTCRATYDYVFTTGGIGPTHDDITTECVAKAFGVPVIRSEEAETRLRKHYDPKDINEARLKMANTPEGAALIDNPVSSAPGYRMENVYVFAGVPAIMQAMFDSMKHELKGGAPTLSRALNVLMAEGDLAMGVDDIQAQFPEVEVGSYPMIHAGKLATSLVMRSQNEAMLDSAFSTCQEFVASMGGEEVEKM